MAWFAWLALLGGLSTGLVARSAVRTPAPPLAEHFPGQPRHPGPRPLRLRTWAAAALVAVAAVAALTLLDAPAGATVAAGAVGAVVLGAMSVRLQAWARDAAGVRRAVDGLGARLAMPYAGKAGVHVGMWSPWIDRSGVPWCVVAHDRTIFVELAAMHPHPVVLRELPATVRGAVYPHGARKNEVFLARDDVTHAFLGHGDSDKPLSASDRVLAYDLVAVAGQAAIDRFADAGIDVPADRLRVIGRPQTEGIERATGPVPEPPTVLYAPTWRHADDTLDVSSLAVADRIVGSLLARGCTVVFRRHFAGRNHVEAEAMIERVYALLEADAAATGRAHRWGEDTMRVPLVQAFNACDAMVSDVSGIVVDFMASEKPLVMYARQASGPDAAATFRASHPTACSAYVVDRDLVQLPAVLDAVLGEDPLSAVRPQRADHYLGGALRDAPAERFIALLHELAGPPAPLPRDS